jgi:hypothetical protein
LLTLCQANHGLVNAGLQSDCLVGVFKSSGFVKGSHICLVIPLLLLFADRVIDRYQQKFPDRSEDWLYEKAFYDLDRDRQ